MLQSTAGHGLHWSQTVGEALAELVHMGQMEDQAVLAVLHAASRRPIEEGTRKRCFAAFSSFVQRLGFLGSLNLGKRFLSIVKELLPKLLPMAVANTVGKPSDASSDLHAAGLDMLAEALLLPAPRSSDPRDRHGYYTGLLDDGTDPDWWPILEYDPEALNPRNCVPVDDAAWPSLPLGQPLPSRSKSSGAQDEPSGATNGTASIKKKKKEKEEPELDDDQLLEQAITQNRLAAAANPAPSAPQAPPQAKRKQKIVDKQREKQQQQQAQQAKEINDKMAQQREAALWLSKIQRPLPSAALEASKLAGKASLRDHFSQKRQLGLAGLGPMGVPSPSGAQATTTSSGVSTGQGPLSRGVPRAGAMTVLQQKRKILAVYDAMMSRGGDPSKVERELQLANDMGIRLHTGYTMIEHCQRMREEASRKQTINAAQRMGHLERNPLIPDLPGARTPYHPPWVNSRLAPLTAKMGDADSSPTSSHQHNASALGGLPGGFPRGFSDGLFMGLRQHQTGHERMRIEHEAQEICRELSKTGDLDDSRDLRWLEDPHQKQRIQRDLAADAAGSGGGGVHPADPLPTERPHGGWGSWLPAKHTDSRPRKGRPASFGSRPSTEEALLETISKSRMGMPGQLQSKGDTAAQTAMKMASFLSELDPATHAAPKDQHESPSDRTAWEDSQLDQLSRLIPQPSDIDVLLAIDDVPKEHGKGLAQFKQLQQHSEALEASRSLICPRQPHSGRAHGSEATAGCASRLNSAKQQTLGEQDHAGIEGMLHSAGTRSLSQIMEDTAVGDAENKRQDQPQEVAELKHGAPPGPSARLCGAVQGFGADLTSRPSRKNRRSALDSDSSEEEPSDDTQSPVLADGSYKAYAPASASQQDGLPGSASQFAKGPSSDPASSQDPDANALSAGSHPRTVPIAKLRDLLPETALLSESASAAKQSMALEDASFARSASTWLHKILRAHATQDDSSWLQDIGEQNLQLPTLMGPIIAIFRVWVVEVAKQRCHHARLLTDLVEIGDAMAQMVADDLLPDVSAVAVMQGAAVSRPDGAARICGFACFSAFFVRLDLLGRSTFGADVLAAVIRLLPKVLPEGCTDVQSHQAAMSAFLHDARLGALARALALPEPPLERPRDPSGYYTGLLDDGTDPDYWPILEYDPAALSPRTGPPCSGQGPGPLLANGAGGESATADATAHAELEPEASVVPEGGAFLDAGDLEAPFEVQRGRRGRAAAKSSSCSPAKGSSYSPDAYEVTSEAKDGGAADGQN
ncbi:hypothetical protein WJX84_000079, partial [Apatococcus fuscideae]